MMDDMEEREYRESGEPEAAPYEVGEIVLGGRGNPTGLAWARCGLWFEEYAQGGDCLEFFCWDDDMGWEPLATASVWVPGLGQDQIGVKDYSENEGMLDELLRLGLVFPPRRTVASGFVQIPVCTLTPKALEIRDRQRRDEK